MINCDKCGTKMLLTNIGLISYNVRYECPKCHNKVLGTINLDGCSPEFISHLEKSIDTLDESLDEQDKWFETVRLYMEE